LGSASSDEASLYFDLEAIMKLKITYSLLFGSLGILTIYLLSLDSDVVKGILSTSSSSAINASAKSSYSVNDNDDIEEKFVKIINSIGQLQKNIENQDKKFQIQLARLKSTQLGEDNFSENNEIEEVDENFTAQEKEEQSNAWYKNQTDAIESAMASEKIDDKWTEDTQLRLEAALEISSNNLEIQAISCGESICKLRAEMKEGDMGSGPNIDHLMYGDMEWEGPILSKYDADTGEVTVFMMQAGVDMSDFEPEG